MRVNKDMLWLILGFGITALFCFIMWLSYDQKVYCWQFGIVLSLLFVVFGLISTPVFLTERVEHSKEIVSIKGKYFDETNGSVLVYTKDGDKTSKHTYIGGINEIKYKGDTAKVEYVEYELKDLSIVEKVLYFPANLTATPERSTEGVTIVIPENEK